MTVEEFLDVLSHVRAGEFVTYHTGFLAEDRELSLYRHPTPLSVEGVAAIAWHVGAPKNFMLGGKREREDCSGMGAGDLVSRRIGEGKFEYLLKLRRTLTQSDIAELRRVATNAIGKAMKEPRRKAA